MVWSMEKVQPLRCVLLVNRWYVQVIHIVASRLRNLNGLNFVVIPPDFFVFDRLSTVVTIGLRFTVSPQ